MKPEDVPDYVQTYDDFWREIVENPDGTLNRDQVMRELHDYRTLLEEVPKAYDEVTGGRLSKPNTAAQHVIAAVDERIETAWKETREHVAVEIEDEERDPGSEYERGLNVAARIARGEAR